MRISGIQKMTLLDYPGHIACTLFTPGCDLRCPFCHNSALVNDYSNEEYYPDEVLDFLATRKGKLSGVAITGGEPLMQKGIADFLQKVKDLGFKVKLDTNGTYPDRLAEILKAGLADYVAMDIKNCPSAWIKTTGMEEVDPVLCDLLFKKTMQSMQLLKNSGVEFEFRTTVVRELHTEEGMRSLAQFIGPVDHYFLQSFNDSGDILRDGYSAWDKETLYRFLDIVKEYIPNAQLRGVD